MKRIVKGLLIVLVILVAAIWLLIDPAIEYAIETEGSKALKARIDVDDVAFQFFPPAIEINGLKATNPQQPMTNAVEIASAALAVDIGEILSQHIIADEVRLTGLRFNQPRERSGAIAGLTPEPQTDTDESATPALNLPDPKALLEQHTAAAKAEIDRLHKALENQEQTWEQRIDELPDEQQLETYKKRFKDLKKGNVFSGLSELNQLKDDIKDDLDNIKSLKRDMKTQIADAKQQVQAVRQLQQVQQVETIIQTADIDSASLGKAAESIVGEKYSDMIRQLLALSKTEQAPGASAGDTGADWRVTVRKVLVDGQFDIGTTALPFEGKVNDLDTKPALAPAPTTFSLAGKKLGAASFRATGQMDHRGDRARDQIEWALTQLPLERLTLVHQPQLSLLLQSALATIDGKIERSGSDIAGSLRNHFADTELAMKQDTGSSAADAVLQSLARAQDLNLSAAIAGTIKQPNIDIDSNLQGLLGEAIKNQLTQRAAALKDEYQQQLQQTLSPKIAALQDTIDDMSGLQTVLAEKETALNNLY